MKVTTGSLRMGLVIAAAVFLQHNATAQITLVPYGDAYNFAILAHTSITDVPNNLSIIHNGNVGVYSGSSITGLLATQVPDGTIYRAGTDSDPLLILATKAASDANGVAVGEKPTAPNLGLELGGLTLIPGVYTFDPGTVHLDGILTLNANGEANPVWIFQATSDLVTGGGAPGEPGSSVRFLNEGVPCDVLWVVPTQATIGTYSDFVGTIIAGSSIVMNTGATLHGRAWALNGDVTLDTNTITGLPCTSLGGAEVVDTSVPDSGITLLLLGSGLATLLGFRRRFRSLV